MEAKEEIGVCIMTLPAELKLPLISDVVAAIRPVARTHLRVCCDLVPLRRVDGGEALSDTTVAVA